MYFFSERLHLVKKIGNNPTLALVRKVSHLKTGFVPTMTERFQFVVLKMSALAAFVTSRPLEGPGEVRHYQEPPGIDA